MKSLTVCLLILGVCAVHSLPKRMKRSDDIHPVLDSCLKRFSYKDDEEEHTACILDCIAEKSGLSARSQTEHDIANFAGIFYQQSIPKLLEAVKTKCHLVEEEGECKIGSQIQKCLEGIDRIDD